MPAVMDARFIQPLQAAARREHWLALLPVLVLALPAAPYLAFPVIMWLKAPGMMHSGWYMRSVLLAAGLLACALYSLAVACWTSRQGYARALELLQTTDVLLYSLLQDDGSREPPSDMPVLSQPVFADKGRGLGTMARRLERLGQHFDTWCGRVQQRYEPLPVLYAGFAIRFIPVLIGVLFLYAIFSGRLYLLNALWVLVPLTLLYEHSSGCGLRSGAHRAVADYLAQDMDGTLDHPGQA